MTHSGYQHVLLHFAGLWSCNVVAAQMRLDMASGQIAVCLSVQPGFLAALFDAFCDCFSNLSTICTHVCTCLLGTRCPLGYGTVADAAYRPYLGGLGFRVQPNQPEFVAT